MAAPPRGGRPATAPRSRRVRRPPSSQTNRTGSSKEEGTQPPTTVFPPLDKPNEGARVEFTAAGKLSRGGVPRGTRASSARGRRRRPMTSSLPRNASARGARPRPPSSGGRPRSSPYFQSSEHAKQSEAAREARERVRQKQAEHLKKTKAKALTQRELEELKIEYEMEVNALRDKLRVERKAKLAKDKKTRQLQARVDNLHMHLQTAGVVVSGQPLTAKEKRKMQADVRRWRHAHEAALRERQRTEQQNHELGAQLKELKRRLRKQRSQLRAKNSLLANTNNKLIKTRHEKEEETRKARAKLERERRRAAARRRRKDQADAEGPPLGRGTRYTASGRRVRDDDNNGGGGGGGDGSEYSSSEGEGEGMRVMHGGRGGGNGARTLRDGGGGGAMERGETRGRHGTRRGPRGNGGGGGGGGGDGDGYYDDDDYGSEYGEYESGGRGGPGYYSARGGGGGGGAGVGGYDSGGEYRGGLGPGGPESHGLHSLPALYPRSPGGFRDDDSYSSDESDGEARFVTAAHGEPFMSAWQKAQINRLRRPDEESYRPDETLLLDPYTGAVLGYSDTSMSSTGYPPHKHGTMSNLPTDTDVIEDDMMDMLYFIIDNVDDYSKHRQLQEYRSLALEMQADNAELFERNEILRAEIETLINDLEREEQEGEAHRAEMADKMVKEFLEMSKAKERKKRAKQSTVCAIM